MVNKKLGTLYVVATPIGNLQDITLRAINILKIVDRIAAEDTRHAMILLKHFSIAKPIISLHEFNEQQRLQTLLSHLQSGEQIALISDAGTPLVSDPGFRLVKAAKALSIDVIPIPGPCALIAALSVAGLPTHQFTFEGFLPVKLEAKINCLRLLKNESRTMIFYEAPRRLLGTLSVMLEIFGGEREAAVAKELTKVYETVKTADLSTLLNWFELNKQALKGEMVIVVAGADSKNTGESQVLKANEVLDILLKKLPLKQAVSLASELTGEPKNALYRLALAKKKQKS